MAGKVYWCARDMTGLKVVGNHHFITIAFDSEDECTKICKSNNVSYEKEEKSGLTLWFCTLGTLLLHE